jgi:tetratricopeptide (TPR) repeat protein
LTRKLPDPQRAASETDILEKLATIYAASFDMNALETYEALVAKAAYHGLNDVHVRALIDMAYFLSWISSQRCLEVIERALRLGSGQADSSLQARMRVTYFNWRIMAGRWDPQHAAECCKALSEIRQAGDRLVLARHQIDYSFIQWASSAYREAHHSALESRAILFEGREENAYLSRPYWSSQVVACWSLMFLGEWGNALSESEAAITMLARNCDEHRAQMSRLYRAWVFLHAMDPIGVLAICESILPLVARDPARIYLFRLCLILAGSADVALGNHERAFERLSAARDEMDRQTVVLDWYWRMQLESSLTELWLAKGDYSQARPQAERFLNATLASAERTWQALAWEANARVALGESRTKAAQNCITQALSTIQGFEAPLAAWRVHASAADVCARANSRDSVEHHRNLSRATILRLANSLPEEEPLRHTFLSSRLVAKIVAEPFSVTDRRVDETPVGSVA